MKKGEKPLVIMMKVVMARVIVVVVAVEMMRMMAIMILKAIVVKAMIANIVAMIWVNPPSDREDEDERPFF